MKLRSGSFLRLATVMLAGAVLSGVSTFSAAEDDDQQECGPLAASFGPFDYRTVDTKTLKSVEDFHFTPKVERIVSGNTGTIEGDLSYTLRVLPNHHRALFSFARLALREKKSKFATSEYSLECWFERASRFAPDDGQVLAIEGYYLSRKGDRSAAVRKYKEAIELGVDSADTYYSYGLLLFDLKQYDASLEFAKKAYAQNFPLPALRKKLQALGKWVE
jgi:tetratricopeptide (TPR) repeat protein